MKEKTEPCACGRGLKQIRSPRCKICGIERRRELGVCGGKKKPKPNGLAADFLSRKL